MRVRRWIASGCVAAGLLLMAASSVGAADVSIAPSTIGYNTNTTLKATGLTPKTMYTLTVYDHFGLPAFSADFPAGADGTFTTTQLTPDPTDQPGLFTFEISAGGRFVARTTGTLVGTNTYYFQHRLGA
jgi:hypothetical protein